MPAAVDVDLDSVAYAELAAEQMLGQRVLDPLLDQPFERPGAERGIVAFVGEQLFRRVGDLHAQAALGKAFSQMSELHFDDPRKLLSLRPFIDRLEADAREAETDSALRLKTVAAAMRADGLGIGWVHFRVNAKQLHNAIRRRIDPTGELDLATKSAIIDLREAIAEVRPHRANFAALAIESSTAIRQSAKTR